MIWVDVKYLKMRFLVTLKRTTFYNSLSRGLAVGILLNVAQPAPIGWVSQLYRGVTVIYKVSRATF